MTMFRDIYLALVFRTGRTVRRFLDSEGLCVYRKGPFTLAFPASPAREELCNAVKKNGIDALFSGEHNIVKKDSRTTTAVIAQLPSGVRFFLKRNNNKGFGFTMRKLFLADRSFRAAAAAAAIEKLDIPTPHVWLAGEARNGMRLRCGYFATEEVVPPIDLTGFFENDSSAPEKAGLILDHMVRIAATLHRAGLYHGDLKIVNYYCADAQFNLGVWDLDSVRIYDGEVPVKRRIRDIARIVSSHLIFAEHNPSFPEEFFNLNPLAERAASMYNLHAAPLAPISASDIAGLAVERWLSSPKLHHHYGV